MGGDELIAMARLSICRLQVRAVSLGDETA